MVCQDHSVKFFSKFFRGKGGIFTIKVRVISKKTTKLNLPSQLGFEPGPAAWETGILSSRPWRLAWRFVYETDWYYYFSLGMCAYFFMTRVHLELKFQIMLLYKIYSIPEKGGITYHDFQISICIPIQCTLYIVNAWIVETLLLVSSHEWPICHFT